MYFLLLELFLSVFLLLLLVVRMGCSKLPICFYLAVLIIFLVVCLNLTVNSHSFRYDSHYIVYYFFSVICFAYLSLTRPSRFQLVSFVNTVYFIYIGLCFFLWLFEITLPTYSVSDRHSLSFFGVDKSVLVGLDGSPSSIDSFSGLTLLLNYYYGVGTKRNIILLISFVAVLLTWRLTPLVAIFLTVTVYYVVRSSLVWAGVLLTALFFLFSTYIYSYFVMQAVGGDKSTEYYFLYLVTHARSTIWGQQLAVMLEHYSLVEYFLGGFRNELFTVPLYQINGEMIDRYSYNSHSSFLLLFFRNPFLFGMLLIIFVFLSIKNFQRKNAALTLYIFLCMSMNSGLLASGNLIFTIVLIFLFLSSRRYRC